VKEERLIIVGTEKPKGLLGRLGIRATELPERRPTSQNPEVETANQQIDSLLRPIKWEQCEDIPGSDVRRLDIKPDQISLSQLRDQENIIFRNIVDWAGLKVGWCPDDDTAPAGFQIVRATLDGLTGTDEQVDHGAS
jgi:hypothetical protein